MQTRRVVITGMGSISPFGRGVDILIESLFAMKSGVTKIPGLADFGGLRTHVAAVVPDMDFEGDTEEISQVNVKDVYLRYSRLSGSGVAGQCNGSATVRRQTGHIYGFYRRQSHRNAGVF